MLRSLHVENYALIDSLSVNFSDGLVIITGQTGAGKSILLGALSLVLGAKADTSHIGSRSGNCIVEAEFDLGDEIRERLDEEGIDTDEGLVIRRVIAPTGRSRAFINDYPVQLGFLTELSSLLVDIHSQHQTLRLGDASFRLGVLDSFAGADTSSVKQIHAEILQKRKKLEKISSELVSAEREKAYNQSLFDTLEAAKLRDGEQEELEEEDRMLSNAEQLRESLSEVLESTCMGEELDVLATLKEAAKKLSRAGAIIPSVSSLSERMDSVRTELSDIMDSVAVELERINASPSRLEQVQNRLSTIYALERKHGVSSVAELIAERERLGNLLFGTEELSHEKETLELQLERLGKDYQKAALELRGIRSEAAGKLSSEIESSLRFLELDKARFAVLMEEAAQGPAGMDSVRFMFSSAGGDMIDVSKCASGGELSRIMLTIKSIMGRHSAMPTMVFDEIDTGVSGSAADKMGSMICSMGEYMQVVAITHLPQVAAKGGSHYLVSRRDDATTIERLSGEGRIMEIARLLSGATITQAAIANAQELMNP